MQKQYDIHRAARPHDQGTHEKYKGAVDFCGGAYGILKGAVQREREMTEGGTASSAGAGVKEGGTASSAGAGVKEASSAGAGVKEGSSAGAGVKEGTGKELQPEDSDRRRKLQDIEIRERAARLVTLELDNMEREQALQALKAKTGGAHQSQVRLRIAQRRGLQRVCL